MGTNDEHLREETPCQQAGGYWPQVGTWDDADGLRVALLDLDGTLIDSELARAEAWDRSLTELGVLMEGLDAKKRVSAYRAVYKCHSHITGKKGPRGHVFEDVRQEWNTRSSYALLIAWFKMGLPPLESDYHTVLEGLLEAEATRLPLLRRAEEIRDPWSIEYAVPIERAVAVFWEGDWSKYLYPGVRELLCSLTRAGICYCVATEGHVPTQWQKIWKVGLNERDAVLGKALIEQEQLLATSQAAQPRSEIDAMNELIGRYHGRAEAAKEAAKRLEENPADDRLRSLANDANNDARAGELVAKGLDRISGLFRRLAEKLHDHGGTKFPFYARTLYAINRNPQHPRSEFLTFKLEWYAHPKIRVAMVGDNYMSDVRPVVALVEKMRSLRPKSAKIMTIWLQKTGHGGETPKDASLEESQWLAADRILDAGLLYLLDADKWRKHTECLAKPPGLFGSAVDPEKHENYQTNLNELIAGIGTVWGDRHIAPSTEPENTLSKFMSKEWFDIIVADIRSGSFKEDILDELCFLCFHPTAVGEPLFRCKGSHFSTLQLLLSVAAEEDGTLKGTNLHPDVLALVATLLRLKHELVDSAREADERWAAATIAALVERKAIQRQIAARRVANVRLIDTYTDALVTLIAQADAGRLKPWFPQENLRLLNRQLRRLAGDPSGDPPILPGEPPPEGVDQLGEATKVPLTQQSVRLGKSNAEREVWCRVGGHEARNIIGVCGDVGTGKFTTLTTLVAGALRGSGNLVPGPPQSSVIVFNNDPSDAAEKLASFGQQIGVPVELVVLPNEVTLAKSALSGKNVTVRQLQYRPAQLNDEVLTEWVCDSRPIPAFSEALKRVRDPATQNFNLDALMNAVAMKQFPERAAVRRALEDLRPFLAPTGTTDTLAPRKLTILDAGRLSVAPKTKVAKHWNRFLFVLSHPDPAKHRGPEEQYLLVFDELAQMFGEHLTEDAKILAQTLEGIAGVGRHLHTSILGISQKPDELLRLSAFRSATVLLFHKLSEFPPHVPHLPLWDLAHDTAPNFSDLAVGEVWYFSRGEGGEVTAGRVQIPRTGL